MKYNTEHLVKILGYIRENSEKLLPLPMNGLASSLVILLVGQFIFLTPGIKFPGPLEVAEKIALYDMVLSAKKPVLSDDMVLIMRAGKEVQMEPAIFRELADKNLWDQQPLIDKIKNKDFSLIIINKGMISDRWTPMMLDAIDNTYTKIKDFPTYSVFMLEKNTELKPQ